MTACFLKRYIRDERGVSALIFALMAPIIIASAGLAVDLSAAYTVRSHLANALDKAALAAAGSDGTEAELQAIAQAFFNANYNDGDLGDVTPIHLTLDGGKVTVTASASVNTTFMSYFDYDDVEVDVSAQVAREVRGLEVAMVLDNTGSMATNNNIQAVRDATKNFVNILFDATSDPEFIKIGMVPYSSSVNVGRYGLGLNPDGTAYADSTVFVTLPSGISYTTNHNSSTGWNGCVVEHHTTNYSAAATHVSNSYGQLWKTAASCTTQSNCRGHGWDGSSSSNDPYSSDIPDNYQGPWDIYMYGTITKNCSGTCNPKYTFNKNSRPNTNCPVAGVIPLVSDRDYLLANADTMTAAGYTLSNVGMAWGYRLLSPAPPFEEGTDWEDEDSNKALVMMTDGETMMGGDMTSYWFDSKNSITNSILDDRLSEICTDLKEKGVTIYTVTFAAGVPAETKEAYAACATDESHYYDAPSQDELITVFENIARQLASLHITQ